MYIVSRTESQVVAKTSRIVQYDLFKAEHSATSKSLHKGTKNTRNICAGTPESYWFKQNFILKELTLSGFHCVFLCSRFFLNFPPLKIHFIIHFRLFVYAFSLDQCVPAHLCVHQRTVSFIFVSQSGRESEAKTVVVSMSPQARAALATQYKMTMDAVACKLTGFFKGLGIV